ncbi:VWA domain-containing protein [Actinokineospora soli]|uniref:VWA domain-containing protein n=1 Tax=Actinokineospora soli TaxID=1048753 RepID=A0ABW2TJZ0_9PSEU
MLLALDASGSMGTLDGPGQRRVDTALRGVEGAVAHLGPRDVVGVWAFSGAGPRPVVPFGPPGAVAGALGGVEPGGTTPLYRTIAEGVAAVGPSDDRRVSALVVLTDGQDTEGKPDAAGCSTPCAARGSACSWWRWARRTARRRRSPRSPATPAGRA